MKTGLLLASIGLWSSLWFTSDQWGQHLFRNEKYVEAAKTFTDPMHRGVAWYRAKEFEQAERSFRAVRTPEGAYNLGNTLALQGKYDEAIESYDRALAQKPEWLEAQENRELARTRAEALDVETGNMSDGKLGADEIVFDENPQGSEEGGEQTVAGEELSDKEQQAMWMRKVQTSPADFLKVKFSMQNTFSDNEVSE